MNFQCVNNITATAEHVAATADEASKGRQGMVIVRGSPPARGGEDAFRGRGGGNDGIVKNRYANDPGKLAAWISASHVQKSTQEKGSTNTLIHDTKYPFLI